MNDVDCVIKCDVYPQKIHLVSKNNHGISLSVLKTSVVYQKKNIGGVIACIFHLLKDKLTYFIPAIMTTVLPTMKTGIPVPGVTDASSSLGKNKHCKSIF